jgi:hypothetical protein
VLAVAIINNLTGCRTLEIFEHHAFWVIQLELFQQAVKLPEIASLCSQ